VLFDHEGREVARHQLEHAQHHARPGWVEHDPIEIWDRAREVIAVTLDRAELVMSDLSGIGITNQRETTVVWERATGRPVGRAIVWQDTRNARSVEKLVEGGFGPLLRTRTGLPPTTYPSATKLQWVLDESPEVRRRAARGELLFGTIDSWLIWRMTGQHVTDVTNASRTMLMNLETLDWDDELLELFNVPRAMLAAIGPSTRESGELVAHGVGDFADIAVTGILGDQQAAMVGQQCFAVGDAKSTYGTGNFVLVNTGSGIVRSEHGLITTVCYQFGDELPSYALEGAIATTGSAVQWLRDRLGIIERAEDSEALAMRVAATDGLYFVPAFSGLFAPHWRSDARGLIVGLTHSHSAAHIARATLESIGYQSRDVVQAIEADLGRELGELKVDGGMTANALCMQLQADIVGIAIVRAAYPETTVRGAAFAAGLGSRFWRDVEELPAMDAAAGRRWEPQWTAADRAAGYRGWQRAVERSVGWLEDGQG
jgi:glycerol kinase